MQEILLCFCVSGGGHIAAAGFYERRKDRNIWQPPGWVPSVSCADTFAHWCRLKLTAAFLNAPFIKRSPTTQADEIKSAPEVELDNVLHSLWPKFCCNDCVFSHSIPGSEVVLTVSSSRSLSSPLRLLWMKALALLDLDILILASRAFWEWEEKGQRIKQGGFERTEDDWCLVYWGEPREWRGWCIHYPKFCLGFADLHGPKLTNINMLKL